MTVLQLYQKADQYGISIDNFPMQEALSISFPQGWVAIDETRLESRARKKVCLGHEIGHVKTGSFYNVHTPLDIRQKHENRADKWAIKTLITEEDLDDAVAEGYTDIWSLAEYFDVTEDFMRKAVCWYTYGNLATDLYF